MTEIVHVPFHGGDVPTVDDFLHGITKTVHIKATPEFVYAVEFETGIVKVGWSRSPEGRVAEHQEQGERFGTNVSRSWVSPPHRDGRSTERLLIAWCEQNGESSAGAEYFRDVSFDALTAYTASLTLEPPAADHEHAYRSRPFLGPGGVPHAGDARAMEVCIAVSLKLWDGVLERLGDRLITPGQLRRLVGGVHESLVESLHDPAAWPARNGGVA